MVSERGRQKLQKNIKRRGNHLHEKKHGYKKRWYLTSEFSHSFLMNIFPLYFLANTSDCYKKEIKTSKLHIHACNSYDYE